MNYNIQNIWDAVHDSVFHLIGNRMTFTDTDLTVYNYMHIYLNAGADIAGPDFMDLLNSLIAAGNIFYQFLNIFGCPGVDQFADSRPNDFHGCMNYKNRNDDGPNMIQKRPGREY